MANSLSAKKRIRQNAKRRMRNRIDKSAVKTQIRKFMETTKSSKNLEEIEQELRLTQKKIDKLAAKGVLHKNTAARQKSRLVRQFNAVKAKVG